MVCEGMHHEGARVLLRLAFPAEACLGMAISKQPLLT